MIRINKPRFRFDSSCCFIGVYWEDFTKAVSMDICIIPTLVINLFIKW